MTMYNDHIKSLGLGKPPGALRSKTFRHDKYPIQVQCVSDHRAPEGGKQFDDILIDM